MDRSDIAHLIGEFTTEMDRLGPFESRPRLAIAVSGGADSMALSWLAQYGAASRGGEMTAFTVDHGLRAESSDEADITLCRLSALGISGRKLIVTTLARGPGLAQRAREVRYRLLSDACAAAAIPHLLLGHHRGDQVETVMLRALSGSASRGLAGMPALTETRHLRLLRPLLDVPPERLRALLTELGIGWIEDPSNCDPGASRARLRNLRADPAGTGEGTQAIAVAVRRAGEYRAERDLSIAKTLAERATIRPEGYAVLTPGPIDPEALAALLRTIAGTPHEPPIDRVAALARNLGPATLGGVRIMASGRLGPGWLVVRERRAMQEPVVARPNVIWDGRFRLSAWPADSFPNPAEDLMMGALGADVVAPRDRNGLPAAVLHGLPALRLGGKPIAVPHIGFGDAGWQFLFDPRNPASGAPFRFGVGS